MKKKATRFLVLPPSSSQESTVWGPLVPPDATLLVDITLASLRSPDEVKSRDIKKDLKKAGPVPSPFESAPTADVPATKHEP